MVELLGVEYTWRHGCHASDEGLGLIGRKLAAHELAGATVLILVGAVDQDDAGDLVRVGTGKELSDHAAVGVADDHVRSGYGGGVEQGRELCGHPGGVAGDGGRLAAASDDIRFVVAAHPGGGRHWLLDFGPVAAEAADQDDGGSTVTGAAEEDLPLIDVEEPRVRTGSGQRFGRPLVEGDGLDEMRALRCDLEEQRRLLAEYVLTFSSRWSEASSTEPIIIPEPPPATPGAIERGRALYEKLKCAQCHGTAGDPSDATQQRLLDDWRAPVEAADLTKPYYKGGAGVAVIYRALTTGLSWTSPSSA